VAFRVDRRLLDGSSPMTEQSQGPRKGAIRKLQVEGNPRVCMLDQVPYMWVLAFEFAVGIDAKGRQSMLRAGSRSRRQRHKLATEAGF
jgi:hypothetical protein